MPKNNSVEALRAFNHQPDGFDLIITDLTMPNLTGEKLAKEAISIRPDIPIILCTGFSDGLSEKRLQRQGIRAMLNKPVLKHELAKTIRSVLD